MRPVDLVRRLCPRARPAYVAAFENGDDQIKAAGITSPKRLAHFLAQALHETDGLTIAEENGNYSASRIVEVWPSRFRSISDAAPYAHNAPKLFNNVYGNRMGNGAASSGDGYRYRGRGILQTTGREAYRKYGRRCGIDFEGSPDLVLSADHALKPALAEWVDGGCNAKADAGDIAAITKKINGGMTGYQSRCQWYRRIEKVLNDDPNVDFKSRSAVIAPAQEKPKSATAAATGIVVAGIAGAASTVSPTVDHVGLWIVLGVAAVAAIVGAGLLIRHHLSVKE